ncbi:MAG: hypothetical protein PHI05_01710 [Bacilli bacterium]|nr:hypothetical protein [Bacilli bacterium]MDD4547444.1 hypothetical protein [Bacilli bacterium]
MKEIKILFSLFIITAIFSATGVFAQNSMIFINIKIPTLTNSIAFMEYKQNYSVQKLITVDSAKEDHASNWLFPFRDIQVEVLGHNYLGETGYAPVTVFNKKNQTKNITSTSSLSYGYSPGNTMIDFRTVSSYLTPTSYWGEWIVD